jgi:hypothetical protein
VGRTRSAQGRGIDIVVRHEDDDDRRSSHALVRAPLPRPASSTASTTRFAVVTSASGSGARASYVVDVFGATVASLSEDAAYDNVDALQIAATLLEFYPGEVVAVRQVNGDWWISKLAQTSLINRVDVGDLYVRPRLNDAGTSASLLNQGVDLATVWAYFAADPDLSSLGALMQAGPYWLYGTFARAELFPCTKPESATAATVHTVYPDAANLDDVDAPNLATFFGLTPASVSGSLTWFWNGGESTVVAIASGAFSSSSSLPTQQTRTHAAGASATVPHATSAHPATTTATVGAQLVIAMTTALATPADCPTWVPDGGPSGSFSGLLAARLRLTPFTVSGSATGWRYAAGVGTVSEASTDELPITGSAGAGVIATPAATTVGTGTITTP